ncbi:MAG: FkbM family methyltransferase [Bacteroidetes bacterium]|nr:FkbM family methyltransferase [Bacteroidota bacterium]
MIFYLVRAKLGLKNKAVDYPLFLRFIEYSRLIESGVQLIRKDNNCLYLDAKINSSLVSCIARRDSSDMNVFSSVIVNEEYKPVVDEVMRLNESATIKTIIDAGGNVGFATIYFQSFFNDARVIVIEPDSENFDLLQKNTGLLKTKNISLIQKGLWYNDNGLIIDNSFRDGKEWSFAVKEINGVKTNGSVVGTTLKQIVDDYKLNKIDILKIDIEGAERFLFEDADFLNTVQANVRYLIMEIHDEFNIREKINMQMEALGFRRIDSPSVTLYVIN